LEAGGNEASVGIKTGPIRFHYPVTALELSQDPGQCNGKRIAGFHMINIKKIAAGAAIAGALGVGALGVGSGVANAEPWHPGPNWHGGGYNGGPGWYPPPPPPPPPYYGNYGGYDNYGGNDNYGGPCLSGPLGLLHVCA
jgi:hypothetical protein